MDPRSGPYDPATTDALRARAKKALRERLRGLRAALPPGARAERSAAATRRVLALDAWRDAGTVALFSSMAEELDTAGLRDAARAAGKRVCLPVVLRGEDALTFRLAWAPDREAALVPGVWGILEPAADAPVVAHADIDFVLVPALAYDPRGYRLGYGRGHYDYTLPRATRATRVGVCFDFQVIAEVPDQATDQPVDWVATDQRVMRTLRGHGTGSETETVR